MPFSPETIIARAYEFGAVRREISRVRWERYGIDCAHERPQTFNLDDIPQADEIQPCWKPIEHDDDMVFKPWREWCDGCLQREGLSGYLRRLRQRHGVLLRFFNRLKAEPVIGCDQHRAKVERVSREVSE